MKSKTLTRQTKSELIQEINRLKAREKDWKVLETALRAKIEKLVERTKEIFLERRELQLVLDGWQKANEDLSRINFGWKKEIQYYQVELQKAHTLLGRILQQHSEVSGIVNLSPLFPTSNRRNVMGKRNELLREASIKKAPGQGRSTDFQAGEAAKNFY